MTINRLHQVLIGLLAVQLILALVAFWPRTGAAGAAGVPLLGEVKAEEIVSLTVHAEQGDSEVARTGYIKLGKQGDQWVLPDAGNYPADAGKITPLLTKLVGINTNRLIARTAASHQRLQVADDNYVRRIDIQAASGASRTLYLGSSPGAQATHVRLSGQNEVYLAGDLSTWEFNADATSWINPIYFSVPQADVVAITLGNASGQWTFEKDAQQSGPNGLGNWTMHGLAPGEILSTNNVTSLLTRVTSVQMIQPIGKTEAPAYGMAQPGAIITLKTKTEDREKIYTLTVGGAKDEKGLYVAKSSESAYYVRVAEYTVKDLIEKKREDFLEPKGQAQGTAPTGELPTPTPAASAP